jgi:hemoglobin/transferrin/lactoferrin receptor protein
MARLLRLLVVILTFATPAAAADLSGAVADASRAVLPGATVSLLNVASGQQTTVTTDASGRYRFPSLPIGIYRLLVSFPGFSDASRTVIIANDSESRSLDVALELGSLKAEVTVSADRGTRDLQVVPLRADTLNAEGIRELAPVSTGDALVAAPGVTVVGSGPFQVRPRLRGLDSTRVLVLVDGERLNNARTATDRAGVEVGLVDSASIESIEVLGGAGSVLYGTDALSGTINIITNRPQLTDTPTMTAGFDGFFSSNEDGRRGTVRLGLSNRQVAVSFMGGTERFADYRAGRDFGESSAALHASGVLDQADTIDDNFGFRFGRFPDPFNAPFTRTSAVIANSRMTGSSANIAGIGRLSANQTLELKYQRRRAENIGFPDFAQPFFFQGISLPWSRFDKTSVTYTATNLTPWFAKLTATAYYQRQDRLLRNDFSVQFPAPTAVTFFPITVFRLNILSDTRQQVTTPGLDLQATFLDSARNVITAGITLLTDRSEDARTTTTTTTQIGNVALGARGPAANVFAAPVVLGPPSVSSPVRVPNARFRDVGVFLHDEWMASPELRVTGGLRIDRYVVKTENTPGYEIETLVSGAAPAIDRATLPNITGDRVARSAFTGEAGVVYRAERPVSGFAHYVRSYRHPNLEELLFSGPATAGNIVPNITVKPETGHNFDLGTRLRFARANGTLSYFNNTYRNFISTEIVAARGTTDSVSQAINLARVRIQGVEAEGAAPFVAGAFTWLPQASVSYTRGTVLEGRTPLSGISLTGEPQDNITPWKVTAALRVGDRQERWWTSYGVRSQARVSRVSPLLEDSEFLIAQDLFGLAAFSVHRVAVGYDWRTGANRVGATLSVDNLTDEFYREHFQFAPARGRSVTLTVTIRGGR